MNKLNELPKKYPKLFNNKPFYFECGDGWYDLLDTLCAHIEHHIEWKNKNMNIQINQIKEKFGELRFYCSGIDGDLYPVIDYASSLSRKICEICGNRGKLRNEHGWRYTACDEHYNGEDDDD